MARSRRRRFGLLLVGTVLVSSCYVATHYNGWRYRGGRLIDTGILSRPRYQAQFREIPFNIPGTYTFTFSRFPGPDAFVMLATPSEPPEESIQKLATQVRLRVVDQDGRVHCDGSGSPQGSGDQRLVVTSSKGVLGLWHTRLRASRAECLQSVSTSRVGRRRGSRHYGATARSDGAGWGRRAALRVSGNRSRPAHSATRGSRSYATRQHDAYETPNSGSGKRTHVDCLEHF